MTKKKVTTKPTPTSTPTPAIMDWLTIPKTNTTIYKNNTDNYLKWGELEPRLKEFFRFLLRQYNIETEPAPETGVGMMCAYLQGIIEAQNTVAFQSMEFYSMLNFDRPKQ